MEYKKKKLCFVTGTRAEYGLLKRLMWQIKVSDEFDLFLLVTGSHLSELFGHTCSEIERDGFFINGKIDIDVEQDTSQGFVTSTALALQGFGRFYSDINPDLIVLLGDRYELLGAAISAMFYRIPIAHIHGGEITSGAMDDAIRHAITKFSHLHFVATEEYKRRVIQLGESPKHVFNVGGLGVDAINNLKLLTKYQIERQLGIIFWKKNLLVTFHPVTLENNTSLDQMRELLHALSLRKETLLIFTMPNADIGNSELISLIKDYVEINSNAYLFSSLGQLMYLSCLAQVDGVIGNSSSGLLEAPSFKKAAVNIGTRQEGRIKAKSVIDCEPKSNKINAAINKIYSLDFQETLISTKNPYGEGGAVEKIIDHLKAVSLDGISKKYFYDLQ